jgi:hypothetical protein
LTAEHLWVTLGHDYLQVAHDQILTNRDRE